MNVFAADDLFRVVFGGFEDVNGIGVDLVDGVNIARMEGKSDHRFDFGQIHINHAVIIGDRGGVKLFVVVASAMGAEKCFGVIIGAPDRG